MMVSDGDDGINGNPPIDRMQCAMLAAVLWLWSRSCALHKRRAPGTRLLVCVRVLFINESERNDCGMLAMTMIVSYAHGSSVVRSSFSSSSAVACLLFTRTLSHTHRVYKQELVLLLCRAFPSLSRALSASSVVAQPLPAVCHVRCYRSSTRSIVRAANANVYCMLCCRCFRSLFSPAEPIKTKSVICDFPPCFVVPLLLLLRPAAVLVGIAVVRKLHVRAHSSHRLALSVCRVWWQRARASASLPSRI